MYENANPAGYHSVTPSITVRGAAAAIEFYERVFAAKVVHRMDMPDGKVMHAEIKLGDSTVMLGEESQEWGALSPQSIGGTASVLMIYVTDADAVFEKAVAAGAEIVNPMTNQFWGDRSGRVTDPFGHRWMIATRLEEVSRGEMDRRGEEWARQQAAG